MDTYTINSNKQSNNSTSYHEQISYDTDSGKLYYYYMDKWVEIEEEIDKKKEKQRIRKKKINNIINERY